MKIKTSINHTLRGIKLIREIKPGWLELQCAREAFFALQPLVTLFFSARILTELAGERDTRTIAMYVILTVGLSFLFGILWPIVDHQMWKKGMFTFGQQYTRYEGVKFAEMDYEYVDSAEIHQLRENINMRRNNNMGLNWIFNLPNLFGQVVRIVAAAVLLAGMFAANPDGSFINAPWVVLLLLVASIAVPAFTGSFFNGRLNNLMEKISAEQSKSNAAVGTITAPLCRAGAAARISVSST